MNNSLFFVIFSIFILLTCSSVLPGSPEVQDSFRRHSLVTCHLPSSPAPKFHRGKPHRGGHGGHRGQDPETDFIEATDERPSTRWGPIPTPGNGKFHRGEPHRGGHGGHRGQKPSPSRNEPQPTPLPSPPSRQGSFAKHVNSFNRALRSRIDPSDFALLKFHKIRLSPLDMIDESSQKLYITFPSEHLTSIEKVLSKYCSNVQVHSQSIGVPANDPVPSSRVEELI